MKWLLQSEDPMFSLGVHAGMGRPSTVIICSFQPHACVRTQTHSCPDVLV